MAWKRGGFVGVLLVAIGASLWGTDAILRVPLLEKMPPTAIVLSEHLVLLLYSVPAVVLGWGAFRNFKAVHWIALLVIGWGGSALATLFFTMAFAVGNPTVAILLQERLGWRYWPSFAVAMVGAYLISFGDLTPFGELEVGQVLTAALAMGAALLWGSSTVMGRFVLKDMPSMP
jgi:drug/metabolite transporter (DMT)-like permease